MTSRQTDRLFFLLLSVIVMAVLILRALKVPFNHDEATTFYNYVQTGDFIPFLAKGEANNHPLNSFITWIFFGLFGSSVFVLRLSNLVFAPLYFFFTYKLSRELSSGVLRWIFLLMMLFTFPVIEFFALCRGYGLSLTFFTGALWQVFMAARSGKIRHYVSMNLLMTLASLSIMTEVYNFTLLLAWALFMMVSHKQRFGFLRYLLVSATGVVPIGTIALLMLHLKAQGAYIEQHMTGFWDASLSTLFMTITGMGYKEVQKVLLGLSLLFVATFLLIAVFSFIRKKFCPHPNLLFVYLFTGNIVIIIIVARLFFSDFPESRLVLYLYPVLLSAILFGLDLVIRLTDKRVFAYLALPVLFFPVYCATLLNFEYSQWYKWSHIPARFYTTIMKYQEEHSATPEVGGTGLQAFAWSFLARQHGNTGNEIATAAFPNTGLPFQVISIRNLPGWQAYYDTLDYEPVSDLYLLKSKVVEKKVFLDSIQIPSTQKSKEEFLKLLEMNLDSCKDKKLVFDFKFSIDSYKKLLLGEVAINLNDSTGKNLLYDQIHLNWCRDRWDGEPDNFSKSWVMPYMPAGVTAVKMYVWNRGKTETGIKGYIRISELVAVP